MATTSYLPEVAGGMVAGAAFGDEQAAAAITLLRAAGVRRQDLSVVAADSGRAKRLAGDVAWHPWKAKAGPLGMLTSRVPTDLRHRYKGALRAGAVIIVAAAEGQPVDTLAALLAQAGGEVIERWWQGPCALFAPPELAGPF